MERWEKERLLPRIPKVLPDAPHHVGRHKPLVDAKRHEELQTLFARSTADLVFVTSFLDRRTLAKYVVGISWETEVWVADSPTHLIHFNGDRLRGPYESLCPH